MLSALKHSRKISLTVQGQLWSKKYDHADSIVVHICIYRVLLVTSECYCITIAELIHMPESVMLVRIESQTVMSPGAYSENDGSELCTLVKVSNHSLAIVVARYEQSGDSAYFLVNIERPKVGLKEWASLVNCCADRFCRRPRIGEIR